MIQLLPCFSLNSQNLLLQLQASWEAIYSLYLFPESPLAQK